VTQTTSPQSRLAKTARLAAKIVLGLTALVLLVVLGLVAANSFDVPLSAQARTLLAAPPNPYPSGENIYLAMTGLQGPGERSTIEMGQERIDAYNQALDSMLLHPDAASKLNREWEAVRLGFSGKMPVGSARTTSIWSDVKSHRQEIADLLTANQQIYRRYLSLHRLHGYYETARPSFLAPVSFPPQPLRSLFLADVAIRLQTGTSQQQRQALDDMRQDLQMWRTVLIGDGTLISKMLAAVSLHADLILVADFITDPSVDLAQQEDVLDPMLTPFEPKDYRIGNAFAAEFRSTAPLYNTITMANELVGAQRPLSRRQRLWNTFQAHFFKINATENMAAANAAQWVTLGDSDPSRFYRNRETNREWFKQNEPRLSPTLLYNPVGKILVRVAASQNDRYSLRAFDVAAYQRLVYLVFELKRQHVSVPDVAPFLQAHTEWSTHPVDGKPFSWNAETRELTVNTLGERAIDQRYGVILETNTEKCATPKCSKIRPPHHPG
jgi:hypothetical protein